MYKAIIYIIALPLIAISTQINAQNHIVVQNEQHVIYYKYIKENVVFYIEDLKDNEDNFTYHNEDYSKGLHGGPYLGSGKICGSDKMTSKLRDMAFVEFDLNHNGKVDNFADIGYTFPYYNPYSQLQWRISEPPFDTHYSTVMPYYIELGRISQMDFEFWDHYAINHKSRVTGSVNWSNSEYKSTNHPIWTYSIPLKEIINYPNTKAYVRFQIQRVSSFTNNDFYGSFFYPEGNSCTGTEFVTYEIDLSDNEYLKASFQLIQEKQNKHIAQSKQTLSNATTKIPEWDGIYLQLKNGKYVQINAIPLSIAGYKRYLDKNSNSQTSFVSKSDIYDVLINRKYYFLKDEVELNEKVLKLSKNEFKGIFVVNSNSDQSAISKVSLSIYKSHQLDLDGFEILYPMNFSNSYDESCFKMYKIQREIVYLWEQKVQTKRQSLPNSQYLFVPVEINNGVYSFWVDGNETFLFELTN